MIEYWFTPFSYIPFVLIIGIGSLWLMHYQEKDKKKKKKFLYAIIIIIILFIALIGTSLSNFISSQTIEKHREYDTDQEKRAISIAEEGIDYSRILNISRFSKVYANFIDAETIHYYEKEVNKGRQYPFDNFDASRSMKYTAEATTHSTSELNYSQSQIHLLDKTQRVYLGYMDCSNNAYYPGSLFALKNGTSFDVWGHNGSCPDMEYKWNDTIAVWMELDYYYSCGGTCGNFSHTTQIIIFNMNLMILFIGIRPSGHKIA